MIKKTIKSDSQIMIRFYCQLRTNWYIQLVYKF